MTGAATAEKRGGAGEHGESSRPPALDRRRYEDVKEAVAVPTLAEGLGAKLRKVGDGWRGECMLCGNGANSGAFSAVERG